MKIKKAHFQGSFYPSTKEEIISFISLNIDSNIDGKSRIILSPHAGYIFSGKVSAKSFSYLKKDFKTAIVLSTAHTIYASKCLTVRDTIFENTLGKVRTDDDIIDELLKSGFFEVNEAAFEKEHSFEVQLPFLQYINKDFKVVPLLVNSGSKDFFQKTGTFLSSLMKKRDDIVLIISSDLSHYPPHEIAYVSDKALSLAYTSSSINKDLGYFILTKDLLEAKYRKSMDTAACGFVPMCIGLSTAIDLGLVFEEVCYLNSGDIYEAHREGVVGYLGGIFVEKKVDEWKFNLNDNEKDFLIYLAKASISNYLKEKKPLKIDYIQYPKLNMPCAVFVTLTMGGELRGCIGTMTPHKIMADAVCEYAIKAAFEDYRFEPLSEEEFENVRIEISLLSPLKKITNITRIKEGVHGVYVKKGMRCGTYLPQVWEHFKTKEEFLRSLFDEKSGIGYSHLSDADTEIYIYTVEKIC